MQHVYLTVPEAAQYVNTTVRFVPTAGKVTFSVYATNWITERDLAETTVARYEGILHNHVQP